MQQGDGSSGEGSSESESRSIAAQQRLTELRKELKATLASAKIGNEAREAAERRAAELDEALRAAQTQVTQLTRDKQMMHQEIVKLGNRSLASGVPG